MNSVMLLDCTLRDGGYINNWVFGKSVIKEIVDNLVEANIDIIECGFIRNVTPNPNASVFASMNSVSEIISSRDSHSLYAIMIEQRNYTKDIIPSKENTAVDIIRLTFRRNEWDNAQETAKELKAKGYKVCIQPVGTVSYDDQSLISLLKDVNNIKPYAFYIVDTLGVMYRHEMRKFFYLVDSNLSKDIVLGFHSHNNLQMSFSNAQEMMRLNRDRQIIIDASCYGMGRGVGNLATELIANYINNNVGYQYRITPLLNIVDKHLMPIYASHRWGYDMPYFLSAIFKCHPNYATYLIQKETLNIEKIEKILSLIPRKERNEYDASLIETMYRDMQSFSLDDSTSYKALSLIVKGNEIVIIGPGTSIVEYVRLIKDKLQGRVVISVNFIPNDYNVDAIFISNYKRLKMMGADFPKYIIATSNLKNDIAEALFFDYTSLLGEGNSSDNAGAMLIRILKKVGVKKIYLAGFDGFGMDASANYAVDNFKRTLDFSNASRKNEEISKQLRLALSGIEHEIITPTRYRL